jgi:hypothetical protein
MAMDFSAAIDALCVRFGQWQVNCRTLHSCVDATIRCNPLA